MDFVAGNERSPCLTTNGYRSHECNWEHLRCDQRSWEVTHSEVHTRWFTNYQSSNCTEQDHDFFLSVFQIISHCWHLAPIFVAFQMCLTVLLGILHENNVEYLYLSIPSLICRDGRLPLDSENLFGSTSHLREMMGLAPTNNYRVWVGQPT